MISIHQKDAGFRANGQERAPGGGSRVRVVLFPVEGLDEAAAGCLLSLLEQDEKDRLDRLLSASARRQFIVSHALLRVGLSALFPFDPASWSFSRTPYGQPLLRHRQRARGAAFSLTHTDALVACAFATRGGVGIDVEGIDADRPLDGLVEIAFSDREAAWWRRLPTARDRAQAFFTIWTLKESLLKASGRGFTVSPRALAFELHSGSVLKLVDLPPELGEPRDWHLRSLFPGTRHAVSLALNVQPGTAPHITVHRQSLDNLCACARGTRAASLGERVSPQPGLDGPAAFLPGNRLSCGPAHAGLSAVPVSATAGFFRKGRT